jgi:Phosphoesterase family
VPAGVDLIDTIVVVILENRSFDHMLGYLNLPGPGRIPLEGLQSDPHWLQQHANSGVEPFEFSVQQIDDPPHEHATIALQIGQPQTLGDPYPMNGFVDSYLMRHPPPADKRLVMGYYTAPEVPAFEFFVRNYTVCDHWFSSLPTGTQANRLMAMSGTTSLIDIPIPIAGHGPTPVFATTGVRVPAFVISPLVDPATVYQEPLDHTSTLQLLADKFAGGFYSPAVYDRQPSLSRLSDAITRTAPRIEVLEPPVVPAVAVAPKRRDRFRPGQVRFASDSRWSGQSRANPSLPQFSVSSENTRKFGDCALCVINPYDKNPLHIRACTPASLRNRTGNCGFLTDDWEGFHRLIPAAAPGSFRNARRWSICRRGFITICVNRTTTPLLLLSSCLSLCRILENGRA